MLIYNNVTMSDIERGLLQWPHQVNDEDELREILIDNPPRRNSYRVIISTRWFRRWVANFRKFWFRNNG